MEPVGRGWETFSGRGGWWGGGGGEGDQSSPETDDSTETDRRGDGGTGNKTMTGKGREQDGMQEC